MEVKPTRENIVSRKSELLKKIGIHGTHRQRWERAQEEQQRVLKEARHTSRLIFLQAWSPWAMVGILGVVFVLATVSFIGGALSQHEPQWTPLIIQALTAGLFGSIGCWVLLELLGFKLRSLNPTQTDLMTQKLEKELLAEEWTEVLNQLKESTLIEKEAEDLDHHTPHAARQGNGPKRL